jgi:hypothetical protein
VGSQVTMPDGQLFQEFVYEMVKTREQQLKGKIQVPQPLTNAKNSIHNMFFNERHVNRKVYEALCTWANDVPSIGLLQQYLVLATRGELYDSSKQFNYARNLANVKVPIFISCGEVDQLAPPSVQQYIYDHVGSKRKKLVIFGTSQGFKVNAGHNDSLVGLTCRQQIYPTIERWIQTAK